MDSSFTRSKKDGQPEHMIVLSDTTSHTVFDVADMTSRVPGKRTGKIESRWGPVLPVD